MKVNADKSKVMMLGELEELVCKAIVDGRKFERITEFKYLRFVFDGTDGAECPRKVAAAFRPLVNIRTLQKVCQGTA